MSKIIGNPIIEQRIRRQDLDAILLDSTLVDTVPWSDMSLEQRRLCIRHTVLQVDTEKELRQRLLTDFGICDAAIVWYMPEDADQYDMEVQILVRALGGLVAKNGTLVQIMTFENIF